MSDFSSQAANTTRRLPIGWHSARLGDLVTEAQPGFASGQRDPRGVVQLRMNNVTSSGRLDWSLMTRVPADAATAHTFALRPGDILFNNTNSAELVGKSALFEGFGEPVVFSNHFTRIRTNEDQLAPEFLAAWLQEGWRSGLFAHICHRWVGQAAVQRERLLDLEIPLPSVSEQKRIASTLKAQLAAVERARAAVEAQLEAANAVFAACRREIFGKVQARGWPIRRLGDLLARPIKTGISKRGLASSDKRCLTLSAVRDGVLDVTVAKLVAVSDAEAVGNWVMPGAFYVVRGNGQLRLVGRGALAPPVIEPRVLYPDLLFEVIADPDQVDFRYLRFVWETDEVRADIERRARTSAGIFKINQTNLAEIAFSLPPHLEEQRQIAATLAEHMKAGERLRRALDAQLGQIQDALAVLLRRAFSGAL